MSKKKKNSKSKKLNITLGPKDSAIVVREDGVPELFIAMPDDEDEEICESGGVIARLATALSDKTMWCAIDAVFCAKAEEEAELMPDPLEDEEEN